MDSRLQETAKRLQDEIEYKLREARRRMDEDREQKIQEMRRILEESHFAKLAIEEARLRTKTDAETDAARQVVEQEETPHELRQVRAAAARRLEEEQAKVAAASEKLAEISAARAAVKLQSLPPLEDGKAAPPLAHRKRRGKKDLLALENGAAGNNKATAATGLDADGCEEEHYSDYSYSCTDNEER